MSWWHRLPTPLRSAALASAVGVAYLLLARLSLEMVGETAGTAAVWPTSGLGAVALALAAPAARPAIAVAIAIGGTVANLWVGSGWEVSVGFALANVGESLLAAAVLLAISRGGAVLHGGRGVVALAAAALVAPAVAGLAGATVAREAFDSPFLDVWVLWLVADAVGILAVGALAVAWRGRASARGGVAPGLQAGLVVILWAIAAGLFLAPAVDPPSLLSHTYPAIMLTVVLSLLGGLPATVLGTLGVVAFAALGTGVGRGPFAADGPDDLALSVIELQAFLAALILVTLAIAVAAGGLRLAQHELRLARRFSESLSANSPDVVARFDADHRHLYVNKAIETATGAPPEWFIGRRMAEAGAPEDVVERWTEAFEEAFASGEVAELEFEYSGPDGPRSYHARLVPEPDAHGAVASLLMVSRDISERRAMEADLRDARDYTRALVESLNDAMCVVSVDGVMVDANARASALTGYSREELIGSRAPFPYHDHEAPPDRRAVYQRLLADGGSGEFDYTLIHRDGHRVEVLMSAAPLHGDVGEVVGGVRLLRDVTAERRARRAHEASEARFRAFLEFAPDGVVITDGDGRIAVVNARIEQMFGHRREDLVGRPVEVLMPPAARAAHVAHRAGYAADPRRRAMGRGRELMGLRADGTEFPIEVSLSPLETPEGVMMAAAVRDVTERRRAEAALRESEERYRSLIGSLADGVIVHAADSAIIECNPAAERILGMTRGQLMGTEPLDPRWRTIRPDGSHYPLRERPAMRTLATGERVSGELIGVRLPEGGTRWISVSTERLRSGGRAAVVSSFTDVTVTLESERDQAAQRRLATLVAAGADSREVFDAVAHEAAALCGAEAGGVLRFTLGGSPAVPMGAWFAHPVPMALHGIPREFAAGTLSADLIATRRPVRRSAAAGDAIIIAALPNAGDLDAAMAVPVFVEGEVWGSIMLLRRQGAAFGRADEARLAALAEVATLAIVSAEARERLATLATTDELTGLLNRRSFTERLQTECERARRGAGPLSLVTLDIDHFKTINDGFGHPEGDRVLALVGGVARGVMRAGEELARVGGEEFSWLLPGTDARRAAAAAERLRAAVAVTDFGRVGPITISLGVAQCDPAAPDVGADLVARADAALYGAKRAGRNRVAIAPTGPLPSRVG